MFFIDFRMFVNDVILSTKLPTSETQMCKSVDNASRFQDVNDDPGSIPV